MFFKPCLVISLLALASHVSAGRNYQVDVCAYYLHDHRVIDNNSGQSIVASIQLHQKGLPGYSYVNQLAHFSNAISDIGGYMYIARWGEAGRDLGINMFHTQTRIQTEEIDQYHDIAERRLELPLRCLSPLKNIRCVCLLPLRLLNYALKLMVS